MKKHSAVRHSQYSHMNSDSIRGFGKMLEFNAARLSAARLALNLPVFHDMYCETENKQISELAQRLYSLIETVCRKVSEGETSEEVSSEIEKLRDENTGIMHFLSAFADRFTVYEYVLNRVEHRFTGGMLPEGYSDEAMTEEILSALSGVEDQSARQTMIISVIEQLPMRMTRSRFLQILNEGLDAYGQSEKETVDSLVFMLRTAAMLDEPEGMNEHFADMDRIVREFAGADLSGITAKDFEHLSEVLKDGMEVLNNEMDIVMMLQEMLNDLLAVSMVQSDAVRGNDTVRCFDVIRFVLDSLNNGGSQEAVDEKYCSIEGVQESAMPAFDEQSSAFDEISEAYEESLEEWGLKEYTERLEVICLLLSNSRFAELHSTGDKEIVSEEYLKEAGTRLSEELTESFKRNSKLINRAVMAKLITMVPLFIRDYSGLEEYISGSLASCSDQAEKCGCIEIIRELISVSQ